MDAVVELARILASAPVPGDGGRNVQARLDALDARTISARVEQPALVGRLSLVASAFLAAPPVNADPRASRHELARDVAAGGA